MQEYRTEFCRLRGSQSRPDEGHLQLIRSSDPEDRVVGEGRGADLVSQCWGELRAPRKGVPVQRRQDEKIECIFLKRNVSTWRSYSRLS